MRRNSWANLNSISTYDLAATCGQYNARLAMWLFLKHELAPSVEKLQMREL